MASLNAIAAVGEGILGLLADACPRLEYPDALFELYNAANFKSPMTEGISLYLYRVDPNPQLRNTPVRVALDGRKYRPGVPVNLHYLLSSWAAKADRQQRLLGWAIRTLADTPVIPAGVLNERPPEHDVFRPDESVDLVMESLSPQDMAAVWDIAKPNIQPSVAYLARMVVLESKVPLAEYEPVQTRQYDAGKLVTA